ncbi:MAG: hypothetical protein AB1401_09115 [Thermodesulfobacteriota bacterium]
MLKNYEGNKYGTITLMGSGEMTSSMVRVHKEILDRIEEKPVRAVFLDTPAGFQLNADILSEKAKEYFNRHFRVKMEPVLFKDFSRATPLMMKEVAHTIMNAHFIFSGPGSPTYALKNWLGNPVGDAIKKSLYRGSHLVFASAASLCVGKYSMPVYEIYKVGEDPFWVNGLNLLGDMGLNLAVIPHWNNAEGENHDTRFCYMGAPRLKILENQLSDLTIIIGIDEHTAGIFDLSQERCYVKGVGQVVLRKKGCDKTFSNGSTFGFDELALSGERNTYTKNIYPPVSPREPLLTKISELEEKFLQTLNDREDIASAMLIPEEILKHIHKAKEKGETSDTLLNAYERLADMQMKMANQVTRASKKDRHLLSSLMELLITVRSELREKEEWELADEIRGKMARVGIMLEDVKKKTRWKIHGATQSSPK